MNSCLWSLMPERWASVRYLTVGSSAICYIADKEYGATGYHWTPSP